MTKIKICGITNLEDALFATEAGADVLGFIFAESPRRISDEAARDIIKKLPPFVIRVGVFVNESKERVRKTARFCGLDCLQLHGEESPQYCSSIWGGPVIKAFRVKDEASIAAMAPYLSVDGLLLDTFAEDRHGGTGKVFDHDLALKAKRFSKPIILSGGITPSNVKDAVTKVDPYAIDSSSGVESVPGKKDHNLIKSLISSIK